MLREKSQTQKAIFILFHLYEMSRISKSIKTASRWRSPEPGWGANGEWLLNDYFWDEENVLACVGLLCCCWSGGGRGRNMPGLSLQVLGLLLLKFKARALPMRKEDPWPMCLSWLECQPINRNVAGSIPSQSTYLGSGFSPQSGCIWEATDWCSSLASMFSASPSLSPFPSLKSISMSLGED